MKTKKLLSILAILFIALISGCANDDFNEVVGVCPVVSSTIPADKAIAVPVNQVISATFNEEMNPTTITNSSFILMAGATQISGVISYSGNTASFTPSAPLAENSTYLAKITTAVKDITGNALQVDYVWTFTTGLILRPVVIATDPFNNETGVRLNKIITATFSMPMDPATLISPATTFTVKQGLVTIAGVVSYSGTTATFTPTVALTANTVYTCTITNAAKNTLGTAMAANYVWSFTTSAAPTVIATDPVNNAIGVGLNKTVSATFSMVMDPTTLVDPATTFTLKQGLVSIAGVVTYSGSTAYFNPNVNLTANTVYTATISTVAKNTAGVPMASNYVWNFTTGIVVTIPPAASGLNFGVFGGNAGITNQGLLTRINNGSIGTTAASTLVTGFTDLTTADVYTVTPLNNGLVSGRIYTAAPAPGTAVSAAIATQGLVDANAAYLSISPASLPGGNVIGTTDQGGKTLAAGVYTSATTINIIGGDLTLNGSATDVWVFQAGSALTVGGVLPRSVKLTGGALAKNVYWYVGSTAVINYAGGGVMSGTIIASSGVTLSSPANSTTPVGQETVLNGKAISLVASVTMVNTIINVQ